MKISCDYKNNPKIIHEIFIHNKITQDFQQITQKVKMITLCDYFGDLCDLFLGSSCEHRYLSDEILYHNQPNWCDYGAYASD